MKFKDRKHLKRLGPILVSPPIFFITVTALNRRNILTRKPLCDEIPLALLNAKDLYGWHVGKYVIMPDHVHFFCAPESQAKSLSDFIRGFKRWTSRKTAENGITGKIWQREFFDHLLRNSESYSQKWYYVRYNPVRAGLCPSPDEYQFQGEITPL